MRQHNSYREGTGAWPKGSINDVSLNAERLHNHSPHPSARSALINQKLQQTGNSKLTVNTVERQLNMSDSNNNAPISSDNWKFQTIKAIKTHTNSWNSNRNDTSINSRLAVIVEQLKHCDETGAEFNLSWVVERLENILSDMKPAPSPIKVTEVKKEFTPITHEEVKSKTAHNQGFAGGRGHNYATVKNGNWAIVQPKVIREGSVESIDKAQLEEILKQRESK